MRRQWAATQPGKRRLRVLTSLKTWRPASVMNCRSVAANASLGRPRVSRTAFSVDGRFKALWWLGAGVRLHRRSERIGQTSVWAGRGRTVLAPASSTTLPSRSGLTHWHSSCRLSTPMETQAVTSCGKIISRVRISRCSSNSRSRNGAACSSVSSASISRTHRASTLPMRTLTTCLAGA